MRALSDWLGAGVACVEADLALLPPRHDPAPFRIREMDMTWPADVECWLTIHNEAFERAWGIVEYGRHLLDHPDIRVLHTYFVTAGDRPVGAASVGVYRANPDVGVGYYLGFRRDSWRHGLSKALVLHRYHALRARGIRRAESLIDLRRRDCLAIHFDCGFRPKLARETWSTLDPGSAISRLVTYYRVDRLHARWAAAAPRDQAPVLGRPVAWSR